MQRNKFGRVDNRMNVEITQPSGDGTFPPARRIKTSQSNLRNTELRRKEKIHQRAGTAKRQEMARRLGRPDEKSPSFSPPEVQGAGTTRQLHDSTGRYLAETGEKPYSREKLSEERGTKTRLNFADWRLDLGFFLGDKEHKERS